MLVYNYSYIHISSKYAIPMTNNKKTEFCKCLYKRYLLTGGGVILYHKKFTYPSCRGQEGHEIFYDIKLHGDLSTGGVCNFTS